MTDRIAEIEARLDRKREPCQDIYFDSWNWDQKKFHLHAEDDVAYLLAEVRRLRLELDLSKPLYSRRQLQERAEAAEALALELANSLENTRNDLVMYVRFVEQTDDHPCIARVDAVLSDDRLAKLRLRDE